MFTPPPDSKKPPSFLDRYKAQMNIPNPSSTESSYSVGNRIYNGFSNSPHSGGGLDKSGYIDRDREASARQMRTNSLQRYIQGKNRG